MTTIETMCYQACVVSMLTLPTFHSGYHTHMAYMQTDHYCRDLLLISSKQDKDLCLKRTVLGLDLRVFDMCLRVENEVEVESKGKGKD